MKNGVQTSEFWVTVAVVVPAVWQVFMSQWDNLSWHTALYALAAGLAAAGYSGARAFVKAAHNKTYVDFDSVKYLVSK